MFLFFFKEDPAEYKNRGDLDNEMGARKACRFPRELLGPCSGLQDREFGFKEGKPCVIVKLNRIVNFRPRVNFSIMSRLISYILTLASCWRNCHVL